MICPICETPDAAVTDSRERSEGRCIRRRRRCGACNHRFTTWEAHSGRDIPSNDRLLVNDERRTAHIAIMDDLAKLKRTDVRLVQAIIHRLTREEALADGSASVLDRDRRAGLAEVCGEFDPD